MVLVEIFWEWKEQEINHSSFIYLKTDELKANEGDSVTDFAAHHCGIVICIIWLIEPKEKGKFLSLQRL